MEEGFLVDPVGRSGGLCLWWRKEVKVQVMYHSQFLIHVNVTSGSADLPAVITFVYGPSDEGERGRVWNKVKEFSREIRESWLCTCDFNDLANQEEKSGGNPRSVRKILKFQQFIADCELLDLGFKGQRFTWCNKRQEEHHIKERIDRAMGNVELRERFPKLQVFHLEPESSDHCPVLIELCYRGMKAPRSFKFEQMWIDHPGYQEVVERSWKGNGRRNQDGIDEVIARLCSCKKALIRWSRTAFLNNKKEINRLLGLLT